MTMMLPRRRVITIAAAGALLTVLAFVLASWSLYETHQAACQSRNRTLTVLADILTIAQTQGSRQHLTPAQAEQAQAFYKSAFARIDADRC